MTSLLEHRAGTPGVEHWEVAWVVLRTVAAIATAASMTSLLEHHAGTPGIEHWEVAWVVLHMVVDSWVALLEVVRSKDMETLCPL